ncbi:HAMP domain-containing sensor histidine kinase [Clostridium sp. BL-8]|uniref:sensor histidine kinase n=1 Tax=Clostridium sp. BL-8 TaxID=349938 RepID=UPI00098BD982|nr:HAMP domain-containing sensor histidine kinase [Clostridium sp. BL-8]OOM81625.1 sensor histidine kinase YycG [Clostridium sp. BL-8]
MDNNVFLLVSKISIDNSMRKYIVGSILLIISVVFVKHFEIYLLLDNVITIAAIVAFMYVNMIRTKFVDNTFMKGFGIMYLMLTSIISINFIGIMSVVEFVPKHYIFLLSSIQAIFEYCIIANVLRLKNSNLMSLIICIFYTVIVAVLLAAREDYRETFLINSIVLSLLLSIGICITSLKNILEIKSKFSSEEITQVVVYAISIMSNYIGLISFIYGYIEITEIIITIKTFALLRFYKYMTNEILCNSSEEINNNIKRAIKTKKELNSILKRRNAILNDINIMLKRSGDKNNKLIDSIYGGVFLFYSNKLQYINKSASETLNISIDEILGIDLCDFINKYFDITLEYIKESQNYIPWTKMQGCNLDVEVFLISIDNNSKVLYIHDISEVNENRKIKEALEECLEEDEIKKEFFANTSHELKTPINLIFSALQVDQIYLKENNMDGVNKNRKIIKQNCLRLIRTINNFIDANKISEGYVNPDCRVYNIVELVESATLASNKYIRLIENTLTFDADEEEIYVYCDKDMITRIVLNILSNSVKYGKMGGNINVSVRNDMDNYVVIKIENDGLKIDKETIPYIFDKFTKLNKAFNRLKEGSGLGLFLAKALIELQGGNIKLSSDESGNKFIITMLRVANPEYKESIEDHWNMNPLEEKVDVEFSDIYIE